MLIQIRRKLRNVHFLRSTYFFFRSWKERFRWASKPVLDSWLEEMYEREDPWNYLDCPEESDRFRSALHLLENARGTTAFERGFEVGCAEGVFTSMLAPHCKSLLAVDISKNALRRASERCAGTHVKFEQWDLATSPAPTDMDLVVIMDVLELFFRPPDIRNARDKLTGAVRSGGYLLLGNSRQNDIFETSWWGKAMLRGGKRIAESFGEHPQLDLVSMEMEGMYVNALFRKL